MNLFITWNARVVVPSAVEMNNNVFFQFMLIPHFLTTNYTIFTYKLEDCLCKMNAKMNICVTKENVSRETLKNKRIKEWKSIR